MSIASAKWFRGLILASIYILGILGILGSVGGGGSDDCFPTLSGGAGDDCPRPSYTTSFDPSTFPNSFPNPNPNTSTKTVLSGRFIDSAVEGVRFETPTQSGLTDVFGIFKYIGGETVSFSIGDILLGTSTGRTRLTPMDLVPGDLNNPQVVNILRFVQSLDEDNNPDNGIRIPDAVSIRALGQTLDFSLSTAGFEIAANALLTLLTSGSVNVLIDASSAQAHFMASLNSSNSKNVTITGNPICDDFGGKGEFGCRIVPDGAPPNIGLTIKNDDASISIEIANMQHIELIDTDSDPEEIAIAVFVTNNGADSASVSMGISFTDENGISIGYTNATVSSFTPGYSNLHAFGTNLNFQNVSPFIYHGMRLDIDVAGGPITFGEFSQANIFPTDLSSSVGN
jgi:hypothetical protein